MTSLQRTPVSKHQAWHRLVETAEDQYGLVTTAQARKAGVTSRRLVSLTNNGQLRRERIGLYALPATARTHEQALMGACLLSGPVSCASHRSAAWLWGFDSADDTIVEISTRRRVDIAGVITHRTDHLGKGVILRRRGLPVTNVSRTLLDLAAVCKEEALEIAVDHALSRRLIHRERFSAFLQQHAPGRRGTSLLKQIVDSFGIGTGESGFETKLRRALRVAQVPTPVFQCRVHDHGGYVGRLDAAWPNRLLGIEADSFRWHGKRRDWRADLRRRNRLVALGWRILHLTPEDLGPNFDETVELLRRELGPTPLFGA